MKYKSSMYCGHPKECPRVCTCPADCACRERMCRCRNVYLGKRCERPIDHSGYCRTDVGRWFEVDARGPRGVLPPPPAPDRHDLGLPPASVRTKGNPMPAETDYLTSLARELAPEAGFAPPLARLVEIDWDGTTARAVRLGTPDVNDLVPALSVPLGKGLAFAAPEVVRERLIDALRTLKAKVFSAGSKADSAPKAPATEPVAMLPPGYLRVLAEAEQTTEARRLYEAFTAGDDGPSFESLNGHYQERWRAVARASFEGQAGAYERGLAQGAADAAKGGAT